MKLIYFEQRTKVPLSPMLNQLLAILDVSFEKDTVVVNAGSVVCKSMNDYKQFEQFRCRQFNE